MRRNMEVAKKKLLDFLANNGNEENKETVEMFNNLMRTEFNRLEKEVQDEKERVEKEKAETQVQLYVMSCLQKYADKY